MPDRTYTAEQVEAAIEAIASPERLAHAQEVVTHLVPQLQRMLGSVLYEGGWFDEAQEQAVRGALGSDDPTTAIRTLIAEETRLGMLVGVAIGFELVRELDRRTEESN